jgi:hypothetical protein
VYIDGSSSQFDTVQIEYTKVVIPSNDLRLFNPLHALLNCNNMAFPAPRVNYRYLTPCVTYRGYLAQITTSLDFKH